VGLKVLASPLKNSRCKIKNAFPQLIDRRAPTTIEDLADEVEKIASEYKQQEDI
jgi:hypothetical protein